MEPTSAAAALEAKVARLVEESSLGTPGARQLRARDRLAGAVRPGWEETGQHDLVVVSTVLACMLAMSTVLPCAAER